MDRQSNSFQSFLSLNSSGGLSSSDAEQAPEPQQIHQIPPVSELREIPILTKFNTADSNRILRTHNYLASNDINILESDYAFSEIEKKFFTASRNSEVLTEFCLLKEICWSLLTKSHRLFELDQRNNFQISRKICCANVNEVSIYLGIQKLNLIQRTFNLF
jgi:hypothetical protein